MVLLPDKFWENYELLFGVRFQAQLALYPFFNAGGGFNVEALRQALATRAGSWKTILVLNFPNNPTGYSITQVEADRIIARALRGGRRRPQPGRRDRRRLLRPVLRRRSAGRSRSSPGWPAATSGSWPSRSTGRRRRSSSGASAPACSRSAPGRSSATRRCTGAGEEGGRRHPQRVSNCSHVAQSILAKAMAAERLDRRAAEKKASSRPGPRRSARSSLAANSPTSGSRIPSTPATSCA